MNTCSVKATLWIVWMETFHEAAALKTADCLSLTATTILTLLCIVIRFSGTKVDVTKFSQTLPSHGNTIKIKTFARPHGGVNFLPDDRPSRTMSCDSKQRESTNATHNLENILKSHRILRHAHKTTKWKSVLHSRDAPASHRVPKTVTNQQLRC